MWAYLHSPCPESGIARRGTPRVSAPRWESCHHSRPEEARPRRGSSRAVLLGAADSPPCTWALPTHRNAAPDLPCAPTRGPHSACPRSPSSGLVAPSVHRKRIQRPAGWAQRVKMSPEADGNLPSPRQLSPSPNLLPPAGSREDGAHRGTHTEPTLPSPPGGSVATGLGFPSVGGCPPTSR